MKLCISHSASGFTIVELLVVMAVLGVLLAISIPRYAQHVERTREVVLRQNLAATRESIDKFYADRGRYPLALQELVQTRYLRHIPVDPLSDRSDSWTLIPPAGSTTGVFDIRSGSGGKALDGSSYASW